MFRCLIDKLSKTDGFVSTTIWRFKKWQMFDIKVLPRMLANFFENSDFGNICLIFHHLVTMPVSLVVMTLFLSQPFRLAL